MDVRDEWERVLPVKDQLHDLLKHGKMSVQDLSETLSIREETIRVTLNRNTTLFTKVGSDWGLVVAQ